MREEWKKKGLEKDYKEKLNWTEDKEVKKLLKNRIARFLPNPEKNWGPKKGAVLNVHKTEKPL